MKINVKKTKTMVVSKKKPVPSINLKIDGTSREQVENTIYLGHMITEHGKSEKDTRRRIEVARKKLLRT